MISDAHPRYALARVVGTRRQADVCHRGPARRSGAPVHAPFDFKTRNRNRVALVRKPNLFLVGAPKAGTSALYNHLAQHPAISGCRIKEPNFFASDLDLPGPRSEQEYLSLFSPTNATRYLLDASVVYLYSEKAAAAIAAYASDARILMVLRNPVEAMHSWHNHMVFVANEPIFDFREALRAEPDRKMGARLPSFGASNTCPDLLFYHELFRYSAQVERYFASFDRRRIRVLTYDDFKATPAKVYADIVEFLEIDARFQPEFRVVNASRKRRNWELHFFLKKLFAAPARRLLSARLRAQLIKRLDDWNARPAVRAPLDTDLEGSLKTECLPDVIRLSELLGRDLTHWCKM